MITTFKNNNPGNIRWNPKFKGVIGKSANGFAIFSSKYAGLAAMENLLKNYIKKGLSQRLLCVLVYDCLDLLPHNINLLVGVDCAQLTLCIVKV